MHLIQKDTSLMSTEFFGRRGVPIRGGTTVCSLFIHAIKCKSCAGHRQLLLLYYYFTFDNFYPDVLHGGITHILVGMSFERLRVELTLLVSFPTIYLPLTPRQCQDFGLSAWLCVVILESPVGGGTCPR